jgi:hypothetical protein
MIGQKRDVVDPFAQGWHVDADAGEAVEQILAEHARLHPAHQVALAGGHDARRVVAERVEHPHDAALGVVVEVAHFVEQDRPAARPCDDHRRPVRPLQVRGRDGDEGQRAAVGKVVDGPGDEGFAGTAFAGDEDRQRGVHHPRHEAVERLHRRGPPHEGQVASRIDSRL